MAVSDGKGAGGALIEAISPKSLLIAGAIATPGIIAVLVLTIWAIVST